MRKIQSIKGVRQMIRYLSKNELMTAYAGKSDDFKKIITTETEFVKLYENILLNGSHSAMYLDKIRAIKGATEEEKHNISLMFQREVKKDIDTIVNKCYMLRTNECTRNKVYYNGKTMKEILQRLNTFMAKPEFYDKLSTENKRKLHNFLKIEENPNIDKNDPDYETKLDLYYEQQTRELLDSQLLPFIDKVMNDNKFGAYLYMSSRIANNQIEVKNVPTQFKELNLKISNNDVDNLYKLAQFATTFDVKGEFVPEEIKKELCATDPSSVDSADKSKELTVMDIKTILLNAEKYNKPNLQLKPVDVEGQIFAQASDKNFAENNISYEQAIVAIKNGLDEIQAGAKYDTLDPAIAPYVKFLAKNCPTIEFLPNVNLAEGENCRLGISRDADKLFEPLEEAEKYLVDGPRYTKENVADLVTELCKEENIKKIITDDKGNIVVRIDTIARVLNKEIDEGFLDETETILKIELSKYYHNLPENEKLKFITQKDKYLENKNTLLTVNDIKILFTCFEANIENDSSFRMFKVSQKDFEMVKDKPGKMLQKFGCSYEEFFTELHRRYVEAYENKAIFAAGDDPYTPYIRYIMGYCSDITYAPSVGMGSVSNAVQPLDESEDSVTEGYTYVYGGFSSDYYARLVMSLPSAQSVQPMDVSFLYAQGNQETQEKIAELEQQKQELTAKKEKIEAQLEVYKKRGKLNAKELKTQAILIDIVGEIDAKIADINNQLATVDDRLTDGMSQAQSQSQTNVYQPNTYNPYPMGMGGMGMMNNGSILNPMGGYGGKFKYRAMPYYNRYSSNNVSTSKNLDNVNELYSENKEEVHEELENAIKNNDAFLDSLAERLKNVEVNEQMQYQAPNETHITAKRMMDQSVDEVVEELEEIEDLQDIELDDDIKQIIEERLKNDTTFTSNTKMNNLLKEMRYTPQEMMELEEDMELEEINEKEEEEEEVVLEEIIEDEVFLEEMVEEARPTQKVKKQKVDEEEYAMVYSYKPTNK